MKKILKAAAWILVVGVLLLGGLFIFVRTTLVRGGPDIFTRACVKDVQLAINNWHSEYNHFPVVASRIKGEDIEVEVRGDLVDGLLGEPVAGNDKGIPIFNGPIASPDFSQLSAAACGSQALAASGLILTMDSVYSHSPPSKSAHSLPLLGSRCASRRKLWKIRARPKRPGLAERDGVSVLLDQWGNPIRVRLDGDGDEKLANPDLMNADATIRAAAPKKLRTRVAVFSAGRDGVFHTKDDVVSWRWRWIDLRLQCPLEYADERMPKRA